MQGETRRFVCTKIDDAAQRERERAVARGRRGLGDAYTSAQVRLRVFETIEWSPLALRCAVHSYLLAPLDFRKKLWPV